MRTNQPRSRIKSLRDHATQLSFKRLTNKRKSARIIWEIEWNHHGVSWGLDAETLSFLLYYLGFFILAKNLKANFKSLNQV